MIDIKGVEEYRARIDAWARAKPHPTVPETSSLRRIRFLECQGGGMKGPAYISAHKELRETGMLAQLDAVAGSSAGGIFAALTALGCTSEQLEKELLELDFSDFKDPHADEQGYIKASRISNILNTIKEGAVAVVKGVKGVKGLVKKTTDLGMAVPGSAAVAAGAEVISTRAEQALGVVEKIEKSFNWLEALEDHAGLYTRNELGLWRGDAIINWLQRVIMRTMPDEVKAFGPNLTFADLARLHKLNPSKYKNLVLTGTNITTDSTEYYSAETTPNMPVWLAVAITSRFPVGFPPIIIDPEEWGKGIYRTVPLEEMQENAKNGKVYHFKADGGIKENLPLVFKRPPYVEGRPGDKRENPEALALVFDSSNVAPGSDVKSKNIIGVMKDLYETLTSSKEAYRLCGDRIAYMDSLGIPTLDFDADPLLIRRLSESGGKALRDLKDKILAKEWNLDQLDIPLFDRENPDEMELLFYQNVLLFMKIQLQTEAAKTKMKASEISDKVSIIDEKLTEIGRILHQIPTMRGMSSEMKIKWERELKDVENLLKNAMNAKINISVHADFPAHAINPDKMGDLQIKLESSVKEVQKQIISLEEQEHELKLLAAYIPIKKEVVISSLQLEPEGEINLFLQAMRRFDEADRYLRSTENEIRTKEVTLSEEESIRTLISVTRDRIGETAKRLDDIEKDSKRFADLGADLREKRERAPTESRRRKAELQSKTLEKQRESFAMGVGQNRADLIQAKQKLEADLNTLQTKLSSFEQTKIDLKRLGEERTIKSKNVERFRSEVENLKNQFLGEDEKEYEEISNHDAFDMTCKRDFIRQIYIDYHEKRIVFSEIESLQKFVEHLHKRDLETCEKLAAETKHTLDMTKDELAGYQEDMRKAGWGVEAAEHFEFLAHLDKQLGDTIYRNAGLLRKNLTFIKRQFKSGDIIKKIGIGIAAVPLIAATGILDGILGGFAGVLSLGPAVVNSVLRVFGAGKKKPFKTMFKDTFHRLFSERFRLVKRAKAMKEIAHLGKEITQDVFLKHDISPIQNMMRQIIQYMDDNGWKLEDILAYDAEKSKKDPSYGEKYQKQMEKLQAHIDKWRKEEKIIGELESEVHTGANEIEENLLALAKIDKTLGRLYKQIIERKMRLGTLESQLEHHLEQLPEIIENQTDANIKFGKIDPEERKATIEEKMQKLEELKQKIEKLKKMEPKERDEILQQALEVIKKDDKRTATICEIIFKDKANNDKEIAGLQAEFDAQLELLSKKNKKIKSKVAPLVQELEKLNNKLVDDWGMRQEELENQMNEKLRDYRKVVASSIKSHEAITHEMAGEKQQARVARRTQEKAELTARGKSGGLLVRDLNTRAKLNKIKRGHNARSPRRPPRPPV